MDRKQRENEKFLMTSNFSFSHSVFKRLVLHTRKNQGFFGKGLMWWRRCHDLNTNPVKNKFIRKRNSLFNNYPPFFAKPHSSVGSVMELRTGRWFDPWLSQYSFQGLTIVIATGFIPLSLLSVVLTMVMWERSQWLGKNIVRNTG